MVALCEYLANVIPRSKSELKSKLFQMRKETAEDYKEKVRV